MSVPNRLSSNPEAFYDEVAGVCRSEPLFSDALVCEAETPALISSAGEDRFSHVSRSQLLADAFGRPRVGGARNWGNPLAFSPWALMSGPVACSAPSDPVMPGIPVTSAVPQGPETIMNPQPLLGNLNEYDLSGGASNTSVVWSVFNPTMPEETGTFAYVRSGASGGSVVTVSDEVSALHKFTTTATLNNGLSLVAYTKATGDEEPSSIVARRVSASGAVEGEEIEIVAPGIRPALPDAQLVATNDGFVAVYRDGNGQMMAAAFDASGVAQGSPQDLGTEPSHYSVNRSEDGRWILAEIISDNQIRIRSFDGVESDGIDRTLTTGGFPSSPNLSVAMEENGTVMAAWNADGGGIMGTVLNGSGEPQGEPFQIRSSGLANTMSLASDHNGNFIFAWEEAGAVLARVYNGTPSFSTPADFSSISTGNSNTGVQAHVSESGLLTLTWVRSSASGGDTLQDLVRRDYQLNY